ncbi:MAG: succinylglutamate desuccinylase/aspartoacylase family protein [Gammaproteobacteria bacterium]
MLRLLLMASVLISSTVVAEATWGPIEFLSRRIAPGDTLRMPALLDQSFVGSFLDTMVVVTRGNRPGPTLCITAGIHGDEVNGVEIAHRIYAGISGRDMSGTLIVLPAVNAYGFRTGSRYLSDRRDLNRYFPGSATGSMAAQLAWQLFHPLRQHCQALLDLHTGSNLRTNVPQIRTDLTNVDALELARSFGVGIVLDGKGPPGNLRRAMLDAGIPAVLFEAGEPLRFDETAIRVGVEGVRQVMAHLGMLPATGTTPANARVIRNSHWIRVRQAGGIFLSSRHPGESVRAGDVLGTVTDPITESVETVRADRDGLLIGMAVPQVVLTGYALFHLGN